MNDYWITYHVNARYITKVRAENLDRAKEIAEANFSEADFGEARDIDGVPTAIEDENGNFLWEK